MDLNHRPSTMNVSQMGVPFGGLRSTYKINRAIHDSLNALFWGIRYSFVRNHLQTLVRHLG